MLSSAFRNFSCCHHFVTICDSHAGLLTMLCKSIGNTNDNIQFKKYCQYQYFYNQYFCTAIQLAKCDSYTHVSENTDSQNY